MHKNKMKLVSILTLTSISLSMIGCGKKEPIDVQTVYASSKAVEAEQPKERMYTDFYSDYDRREANPLSKEVLDAVNSFTDESSSSILSGSKENIAYSPISLYMALAVLSEGSEGDTAKELFNALGLEDTDYTKLSGNMDTLYKNLYRDTKVDALKISNAVWMDQKFPFKDSYCDTVSKQYHASLFNVDYADPKTAARMEEWIAKELNNVMKPKVEIQKDQVMTIMNTIYYTNQWSDKFYQAATKEDKFYLANKDTVNCDFLNRTTDRGSYIDGDGYKTYELPLESGDSIVFCLPDEGRDLSEFTTKEAMGKIFSLKDPKEAKIILSLPKFDYGCKFDLADTLNQLGIKKAMDVNRADFKRMSDKVLFLSKATQEVHVSIDEDGVTAAAYTELDMKCGCAMPEDLEEVELNFNRPFLYKIQSCDGVTLFTGIVQDPTQK